MKRWSTAINLTRVTILALCFNVVIAQNISDERLSLVRERLAEAAQRSWELGTRAQTLLEFDAPAWSVFSRNDLPPPQQIPSSEQPSLAPVLRIAQDILANRSELNNNAVGPQPYMPDGSAADPASNGVAFLLANWTGQGGGDYIGATRDQLDFLYQRVPKTDDGALSHRVSEVQLWSDFVYMVPPFLAYYGVLTRNQSLVEEAYNQIKLYRQYLRDTNQGSTNLWKHVLLGTAGNDEGHWSTGNAWAAAGMLRVLATIQNSEYDKRLAYIQKDLAHWVQEIHGAMYSILNTTSNIFPNYPDRPVDSQGNFNDAAGTALLAATVYRISLYWGDHSHIPVALRTRATIYEDRGNQSHIDANGWLTPVVNPHSYGVQGQHSAEGQAFVLLMEAAYRDWVAEGSQGANASRRAASAVVGSSIFFLLGLLSAFGLFI